MDFSNIFEFLALLFSVAAPLVLGNVEIDDEPEPTEDDESGDDGSPTGEGDDGGDDEGGKDEDFLAVDERTRYKTRDEAIRGYQEAGKRIASYAKFGSPEEIAAMRSRLETLDKVFGKKDGKGGEDDEDPFEGMDEKERKSWETFLGKFPRFSKKLGFVTKDEHEEAIKKAREEFENSTTQRQREATARTQLKSLAAEYGRENLSDEDMEDFEVIAAQVTNKNKEANEKYFAGDIEGWAEIVFGRIAKTFGLSKKATKERDQSGRFKKEADYERAKDKTKKLPKGTAKGGAPGSEGKDPDEEKNINLNPKALKKRAGERLRQLQAERAA